MKIDRTTEAEIIAHSINELRKIVVGSTWLIIFTLIFCAWLLKS